MKIKASRLTFGKVVSMMAFLLPYIEISAIRELFAYSNDDIFIPAVFPIMLVLYILFKIRNILKHANFSAFYYARRCELFFYLLSFFYLFVLIFKWAPFSSYVQLIEFALPFFYAKEVIKYLLSVDINHKTIVRYGVICFVVTQMFFFFINIRYYGFSFSGNAESRLLSVGGGPVILGYTVALAVALWLVFQNRNEKALNITVIVLMMVISLSTGSRGSMWPLLVVLFFFFASRKGHISSWKLFVVFSVISIVYFFFDLSLIFPRLFDFTEGGRISTITNNLKAFGTFDFVEALFGKGIGCFFPIQRWNTSTNYLSFYNYNHFLYEGIAVLVQPHNSFIFTLMEGGLVGLVIYVTVIINTLKSAIKTASIERRLFVIVTVVVLMIESTFYTSMGSASLWWIILLLYCTQKNENNGVTKE